MFDREVTGSEGADFTITPGTAPTRHIGAICYRLAATNGVEFDASVGGGLQGDASALAMPDLTTNHADCFVGAFAGAYTGPMSPSLSGYSVIEDIVWPPSSFLLDQTWGKSQAVAGSTGTPTVAAAAANERIGLIVASWNEKSGDPPEPDTGLLYLGSLAPVELRLGGLTVCLAAELP